MSMQVTVVDEQGGTASMEIAAGESLETFQALIEAELGVPVAQQVLMKDGQPLRFAATVTAAGILNGDLLLLVRKGAGSSAAPSSSSGGAAVASGQYRSLSDVHPDQLKDPAALIKLMKEQPRLLREMNHVNPDLAAILETGDVVKVRTLMMKQSLQRAKANYDSENQMRELEADPMNPENQKKIEEMLRLQNVQKNWEMAMEEMPEAFGRVLMLYVDTVVNDIPIKAFVDSGAQSTIMSKQCAEKCGLMRLLDTRFAGMAVGVGTAKILGRVHIAQLKVGSSFFPCTFTVLDQNDVDLLFGLDMLKRHQCVIDLKRGVLGIGSAGVEVPFLSEHDLPLRARGHVDGEEMMDTDDHKPKAAETGEAQPRIVSSPTGAASGASAARAASAPLTPSSDPDMSREAGIQELTKLGFSRDQAAAALTQANGDLSLAASLLFAQAMD